MDFNKLAASRKSVRSFEEKDVPGELITKLLEAAHMAPSGGNMQPWHFYVVKNKEMQKSISQKGFLGRMAWMLEAPVLIVVAALPHQSASRYHERGAELYCLQDTAAATQNILLCAKSLGLETCWMGAFSEEGVSEALSLQKGIRPVAIIPVGYSSAETKAPKRTPLSEIATYI